MTVDIPDSLLPELRKHGFIVRTGPTRTFLVKRKSKEARAAENRAELKRLIAEGVTDPGTLMHRVGLRPGQYRYLMAQINEQQRCVKRDHGRPPVAPKQPARKAK